MSDEPNKVVLDYLRAQFGRQDEQHDKTRRQLHEHISRFNRMETAIAALRRDAADGYGQIVALGQRLDEINERLDCIERRLDLADAPP
jgi:chromosome segregation ATPase